MSKPSKITLGTTTSIPVDKFYPVKVYVSITHDVGKDESIEEAYANTYKDLNEIREATTALEMKKRLRIENKEGLLEWGHKLLDELQEGSKRFYNAFLNLIRS